MPLTPEQLQSRLHRAAEDIRKPDDLMQRLVLIGEAKSKPKTPVATTGTLRRSVGGKALSAVQGVVRATADYARYVHDGTRHMAARPFIEQGIEEGLPQMEREVAKYADNVLGKVGG